ncbi:MAG: type II toxin-antitoxin system RelE/ParE family toxin [Colwellia sp.]
MGNRDVWYMGKTQSQIDGWPKDVSEMVNTNLQALQGSRANSFSDMADWNNSGKLTDKPLKGGKLVGSHQLSIKHRDSYRVVYIAELGDAIIVLHSFKKKTEGKSKKDMDLVEKRLQDARAEIED